MLMSKVNRNEDGDHQMQLVWSIRQKNKNRSFVENSTRRCHATNRVARFREIWSNILIKCKRKPLLYYFYIARHGLRYIGKTRLASLKGYESRSVEY